MKIQGDNPIIDELLKGNDRVVFNLVMLLKTQDGARIYTDGKSYLTAQTNPSCPLWIYTNAHADAQTNNELFSVLSEAVNENLRLKINAREDTEKLLFIFAKEHGLKFSKYGTLNAYSVRELRDVLPSGKLIPSEAKYEREIANLIQIAAIDDNDGELSDEEALRFAKTHAGTGNLFLWQDGDIVSMARTVRYGEYARITSVVTKREARGKGYAKMLVGELAKRLLADGVTPVLYARAENPSSNACYCHLGFEKQGEICEFILEK